MTLTRAVLFDMFDTLVNRDAFRKPQHKLLGRMNLSDEEYTEIYRKAMRITIPDFDALVRMVDPDANINTRLYQEMLEADLTGATLYKDAIPTLEQLKAQNILVGLISNLMTPYKRVFCGLGLDKYIPHTFFSCDLGARKPETQIYILAANTMQIKPQEALMCGDNLESDVVGPRNAGMRAVHLDRSGNTD